MYGIWDFSSKTDSQKYGASVAEDQFHAYEG